MNTDQIKGTLKDVEGRIQERLGEYIDSPEQEARGIAKQVEGIAQKKIGDLKEAIQEAAKK
ncbi:general stress protein CsbD [Comamonas thiooxydans]|uniref:General stress protein CsbD n=1 Tax=Comamonas thiooxydans TaxID=363952 RepID=A0A0E3B8Z5_9BURK|nr:CsbD family protein [Comamonas thiooxydans]KGG82939.1 general stress protein CsbD [Comamonas thiooxydans]